MFALVKARRAKKRQKDSSKHVGEPSKGGCSRPRDMICRQHEFVMGHHRDPTVRYLAIALLTYRRLRPSSRCSQSSVTPAREFFSRRFLLRRNVQNTRCRNTSPTRSTIVFGYLLLPCRVRIEARGSEPSLWPVHGGGSCRLHYLAACSVLAGRKRGPGVLPLAGRCGRRALLDARRARP